MSLWVCLISGGILLFLAQKTSDPKPVIKAFEDAEKKNTAGAYRAFCQKYKSSTRYYKIARKKMHILIEGVVEKYRKMIASHNTPIVRAISAMFEYIKKTDNFLVGVHFMALFH